jgi:hypothetical protein
MLVVNVNAVPPEVAGYMPELDPMLSSQLF